MITDVEAKYHKDGPFSQPCVKCDACHKLLLVSDLKKIGNCRHCGNTKVVNARVLTEEDMATAKEWISKGLMDADWLELFEAAPEVGEVG